MTYNRKKIMTRAWEIVKGEYGFYSSINMRSAMSRAWSEAKAAVRAAIETPADKVLSAIHMIENKSRVGIREFARIDALRAIRFGGGGMIEIIKYHNAISQTIKVQP